MSTNNISWATSDSYYQHLITQKRDEFYRHQRELMEMEKAKKLDANGVTLKRGDIIYGVNEKKKLYMIVHDLTEGLFAVAPFGTKFKIVPANFIKYDPEKDDLGLSSQAEQLQLLYNSKSVIDLPEPAKSFK